MSLTVLAAMLAAPASALAYYGAIAVNPQTGTHGSSRRQLTKPAAERAALRDCTGRCRTLLWVRNACAAAVVTPSGFYGGFGLTRVAAIRAARRHARAPHATLVTAVCTG
jgi:hypothetical protein